MCRGAEQAHHTTHWPHVRGLAAFGWCLAEATKSEISASIWVLVAREGLYFF